MGNCCQSIKQKQRKSKYLQRNELNPAELNIRHLNAPNQIFDDFHMIDGEQLQQEQLGNLSLRSFQQQQLSNIEESKSEHEEDFSGSISENSNREGSYQMVQPNQNISENDYGSQESSQQNQNEDFQQDMNENVNNIQINVNQQINNQRQIRCPLCFRMVQLDQNHFSQSLLHHLDFQCSARRSKSHQQKPKRQASIERWAKQYTPQGQVKWVKSKSSIKSVSPEKLYKMPLERARNLPIEEKKIWFEHHCQQRRVSYLQDSITLVISRQNIFYDSFQQFKTTDDFDLHKEIKIFFINEVAMDAGGIIRDWINELTKALLSQDLSLFKTIRSKQDFSYFPNSLAKIIYQFDFQDYYRFAGQVIAKALFDKIPIHFQLNNILLRKICEGNFKVKFEDMKKFDQQIYESLKFIKENDQIDFDLEDFRFSIIKDSGEEEDLIENGKNIQVTQENKHEYVNLVAKYYLEDQCKHEIDEFIKGFYQVIPFNIISIFDSDELDLIINGIPEIDLEDWKKNTQYKGEFNEKHQVIIWFWEILEKFSQEQLRKFLLFCTGMPRIPIEGFKALQSNRNKISKFQIQSVQYQNENQSIISAHTCFNRLDIPLFKRKSQLEANVQGILNQDKYFFDFE